MSVLRQCVKVESLTQTSIFECLYGSIILIFRQGVSLAKSRGRHLGKIRYGDPLQGSEDI